MKQENGGTGDVISRHWPEWTRPCACIVSSASASWTNRWERQGTAPATGGSRWIWSKMKLRPLSEVAEEPNQLKIINGSVSRLHLIVGQRTTIPSWFERLPFAIIRLCLRCLSRVAANIILFQVPLQPLRRTASPHCVRLGSTCRDRPRWGCNHAVERQHPPHQQEDPSPHHVGAWRS